MIGGMRMKLGVTVLEDPASETSFEVIMKVESV